MDKDNQFDFSNWYDIWMKQSSDFSKTAETYLKDLFAQHSPVDPREHMNQINAWLDSVKKQWEQMQFTEEQKQYQFYWKMMNKMGQQTSERLFDEWVKRSQSNQPIVNIRELYELWLTCCHDVYQKTLREAEIQKQYGDFMNAAMNFWANAMANK